MPESPTLLSTDVTDYAPGDLIGNKYRLERFLGEGAQGSIWLAQNLALCAEVAIKLVHGERANPAPTLRLEQEARAAAQIAHPAVVRVFDLGRTARGDAFIVMEFLQGENLGDHLTTCGRLSPVEAVRTLLPIADVLHVAHARGIVHRDVKPENVFLARNGSTLQPKLLDFGIAKLRRDRRGVEPVITDVGLLVGSPAYLSPEQASCRDDIGQAADIWSFCIVLYECLTGRVPFDSENCHELFRRIGEEAPRPILSHGAGDFELWEIIRRGLAKSPTERWPDMHSLGRALAGWLRARGVEDDISGMRLDSRWLAKEHTVPALRRRAPKPASSIRRIAAREVDAAMPATLHARDVRSPSRWLVAGVLVAALIPVVLGYGLVSARSMGMPDARAAKLEPPVVIEPQREAKVLVELAATTSPTTNELPRSLPSPAPQAPEPRAVEPAATPSPESKIFPPAAPKKRSPPRNSDLLEPY